MNHWRRFSAIDVTQTSEAEKTNISDFFPRDRFEPHSEQQFAMSELSDFLSSSKNLCMGLMPPATGKTAVMYALAKACVHSGKKITIVSINKNLQEQMHEEFGGEIDVIMGANNISCLSGNGLSCGAPESAGCPHRKDASCPFVQLRKSQVKSEKPKCFNVHSFFANKIKGKKNLFPDREGVLCIDEAHKLYEIVFDQLKIQLPLSSLTEDVRDFVKTTFAGCREGKEEGKRVFLSLPADNNHAAMALRVQEIAEFMKGVSAEASATPDVDFADQSIYRDWSSQLETMSKYFLEAPWLFTLQESEETDEDSGENDSREVWLTIHPLLLPRSFVKELLSGYSKVILLSGSLFRMHLDLLGVSPARPYAAQGLYDGFAQNKDLQDGGINELQFASLEKGFQALFHRFDCPSPIDKGRRLIFIDVPNGRKVTFKSISKDFEWFAAVVAHMSLNKPGCNGMLHVSSSAQCDLLERHLNKAVEKLASSSGQTKLIPKFFSASGSSWISVFSDWKERRLNLMRRVKAGEDSFASHAPEYIIAARRYEGVDLKDDLARVCGILKVPLPDSSDPVVKSMAYLFKGYDMMYALTGFIQAANRATRNPEDHSLIFCMDLKILEVLRAFGDELPHYIEEVITLVDSDDPYWYLKKSKF
jgi:Rad3-related DNA helicase